MDYVIENISRRPVTILCNSGKSHHLPPHYRKTFQAIEVGSNQMVDKLKARRILSMVPVGGDDNVGDRNKARSARPAKKRSAKQKEQ